MRGDPETTKTPSVSQGAKPSGKTISYGKEKGCSELRVPLADVGSEAGMSPAECEQDFRNRV